MVGDPKALARDPRDLVEFVYWILDVEHGDRTWPRSRYHYATRGNSQMLKVMKDYVIPNTKTHFKLSSLYFRIQDSILGKSSMKEK